VSIVIVGAGEVGYNVARRLTREYRDITIIDKDEHKIENVSEHLDVRTIHGSGSSMAVLRKAGIDSAEILIAATDSDEVNMVSCLVAGIQSRAPKKIARIRDAEYATNSKILGPDRLGIDLVINTDEHVVRSILRILETPKATDVVDFADGKIRMASLVVEKRHPMAGKRLQDFRTVFPGFDIVIAAIYRNNRVVIPRGNDSILERDVLFVLGASATISSLFAEFEGGGAVAPVRRVMIYGGGSVGLLLAKKLEERGVGVRIVEASEERCHVLASELDRATVLKGDLLSDDILKEEHLGNMDAFVAVTSDDENNILLALLAKRMGARRVVASLNRTAYSPLAYQTGVDVIVSPTLAAINKILQYVRRGKVANVVTLPEDQAEVIEVEALDTSDLVHSPLRKLKLPRGILVGAILRAGELIIPTGDTVILPGDRVAMVVANEAIKPFEKFLSVKLEYW
jgi:trk system potassium uptake protein TrkA